MTSADVGQPISSNEETKHRRAHHAAPAHAPALFHAGCLASASEKYEYRSSRGEMRILAVSCIAVLIAPPICIAAGAIAVGTSQSTPYAGFALEKSTEEADRAAINRCQWLGQGCRLAYSFKDLCAAFIASDKSFAVEAAPSKAEALAKADQSCRKLNGGNSCTHRIEVECDGVAENAPNQMAQATQSPFSFTREEPIVVCLIPVPRAIENISALARERARSKADLEQNALHLIERYCRFIDASEEPVTQGRDRINESCWQHFGQLNSETVYWPVCIPEDDGDADEMEEESED